MISNRILNLFEKVDQYLAILKVTTKIPEGLVIASVFGGC